MRRIFVILALLATTWPHVAVMACEPDPASSHGSLASAPSRGSHASAVVDDHDHEGPQCLAIVTCSAAVIPVPASQVLAGPVAPPALHPRPTTSAPVSALTTTEPPPPRRIA